MQKLGYTLKTARIKNGLSLSDVHKRTGITDTRLKRIEDGLTQNPSPKLLIMLASLYNVNLIDLYLLAHYLNQSHLNNISVFENIEQLNSSEIEHIQQEINFLISHRGKDKNKNGI